MCFGRPASLSPTTIQSASGTERYQAIAGPLVSLPFPDSSRVAFGFAGWTTTTGWST